MLRPQCPLCPHSATPGAIWTLSQCRGGGRDQAGRHRLLQARQGWGCHIPEIIPLCPLRCQDPGRLAAVPGPGWSPVTTWQCPLQARPGDGEHWGAQGKVGMWSSAQQDSVGTRSSIPAPTCKLLAQRPHEGPSHHLGPHQNDLCQVLGLRGHPAVTATTAPLPCHLPTGPAQPWLCHLSPPLGVCSDPIRLLSWPHLALSPLLCPCPPTQAMRCLSQTPSPPQALSPLPCLCLLSPCLVPSPLVL